LKKSGAKNFFESRPGALSNFAGLIPAREIRDPLTAYVVIACEAKHSLYLKYKERSLAMTILDRSVSAGWYYRINHKEVMGFDALCPFQMNPYSRGPSTYEFEA
jgi:hypothetical protein